MRFCACLVLLAAALGAQSGGVPVYRAPRTVDAIRIDGKLDEFSWAAAPRVGPFRPIRDPQARPRFATEAAVVWDAENLYVAFACRDADPWSRMSRRDEHLWLEEVVEVFLDPNGDGENYAEVEVNPENVVVDLLIPRPRAAPVEQTVLWNIDGLETAVGRHAAGWTVEIAIPWASLAAAGARAAPSPGERWRAGLYRIKRPGGAEKADRIATLAEELQQASADRKAAIEEKLRELRSSDEFTAWSPTRPERGYHDPERFGILEFVEAP